MSPFMRAAPSTPPKLIAKVVDVADFGVVLPPELGEREHAAILALCSCSTRREAAELSGVPERTLYHWLQRTDFRAAFHEARKQMREQAGAADIAIAAKARMRLDAILSDDAMPPAVHASAIRIATDLEQQSRLEDMAADIEALKNAIAMRATTNNAATSPPQEK